MPKAYLSDFPIEKKVFSNLTKTFLLFKKAHFKKLNKLEKAHFVNKTLCTLIEKQKSPCFLLFAVIDYIKRIKEKKILDDYDINSFELWLNQFSKYDFEKNYEIRAKITGKYLPRDEYQHYFPIGMGKIYEGSHIVTAHKSPDLDSTIASFWGWMDAFSARVGKNLHLWNVPGGLPVSLIETNLLFKNIFSEGIFDIAKSRPTLTLTSKDIMTQEGVVRKCYTDQSIEIERDQRLKAVVIVDENGNYLGDWRSVDVEGVRQIIMLLNNCLRWFENNLHITLISLFAKKTLKITDIPKFVQKVFSNKIKDCAPAKEYSEKQKEHLNDYLEKVLKVNKGINANFDEFAEALYDNKVIQLHNFHKIFNVFKRSNLFDKKGQLKENRIQIFLYLEKIIKGLNDALLSVRSFIEKINISLDIKKQVFGYQPHFVSHKSDIEEVKMKLGSRSYLTVNFPSQENCIPMGVVRSIDLRQKFLGTVSLRDFCNFEEIKVASYLQVISVIDHHKTNLTSYEPPVGLLSDAQATSTLIAEQAMLVNDKFSLQGFSKNTVMTQLKKKSHPAKVYSRLLSKKELLKQKENYFVHPQREFIEYLHFLFGILDDTDLLMKVSKRDVECVANLLNRMRSLMSKKEVEIINLDLIKKNKDFAKAAADLILKNKDMYSLYNKVYNFREKEVKKNIDLCLKNKPSTFFADVKEQNGCCRIGQTKMFMKNISYYKNTSIPLRKKWVELSNHVYQEKEEFDLHLHMISTIRGSQEVFKGTKVKYKHKDEFWIWLPESEIAVEHLKSFLTSFSRAEEIKNNDMYVEFLGENNEVFEQIFQESFLKIEKKKINRKLNMAVLYYNAGSVNSRKAMVSPYLPNVTD